MYLDAYNRTALEVESSEELIDRWLRARTANTGEQAAESFLKRVSGLRSTRDTSRFIPHGELVLADAGHHNPTYNSNGGKLIPGKSRKNTFETEVIPLESMLVGKPIFGSSSHVWIPMIKVERGSPSEAIEDKLPQFLIYDGCKYSEAVYDATQAMFIPKKAGETFEGRQLQMIKQIEIQREYMKGKEEEEVKEKMERESERLHFEERVIWYCKRSQLGRLFSSLKRYQVEIAIEGVTHASFDEIDTVIKEGVVEAGQLSRFLLYKAFSATKRGSYIVGQITGDSYTIHMPYVRVALRVDAIM